MAIQKIYTSTKTVEQLPPIKSHDALYGPFGRIFRAAFFQFAVIAAGWIEQLCIKFYRCGAQKTCCPTPFDDKRMDQSLQTLKDQFQAKEHTIVPVDEKAVIQLFTFDPQDLENHINALGGSWTQQGNEFFIIPPLAPTPEWETFKKTCLNKTGWFEKEYKFEEGPRKVIITSENAQYVKENNSRCFFHIHDRPLEFHKERIGFYLGMKQHCAFINLRGTRNALGTPSEKGFYLDVLAAMEKLQQLGHMPENIWVSGSCKSTYVAAKVKEHYHDQGINFVAEQATPDLKTMIDHQPWLARKFAEWNIETIKARDIPKETAPKIVEDSFSTTAKWQHLPFAEKGKVVIMHTDEDDTLPKGSEKDYVALAQKVNKHVHLLNFKAPSGLNGHNISCLEDKNLQREFTKAIFGWS